MKTLDKLEKLLGEATPGPLKSNSSDCVRIYGCGFGIAKMTGGEIQRDEANANLITTAINTLPALIEVARVLEHAKVFITNGVEFGYIIMPDKETPDNAHNMLPEIVEALKKLEEQ